MQNNKKNGGLFGAIIMGILMVIGGTVLLWWNEGNNVRNIHTTDEVEKNVVEITSNSDAAQYDGQLVALGGKFIVEDEQVTDETFRAGVHTAALSRIVEIYQWEEDEDTDDDGDTTYSYEKVWSEELIDSSRFAESGHDNPTEALYESERFNAEKVRLGSYYLSSSQIAQFEAEKTLAVSDSDIAVPKDFAVVGKYISNTGDMDHPQIGDIRITWKYNNWKETSLIAKVSGNSFVTYTSKDGKNVNYVTEGVKTAAEMIEDMRAADKMLKWALRLLGALLIFFGYMSVLTPLTKLFSFIPLVGGFFNGLLTLLGFLIALLQSLLVIAIAWIRFRPVLGICLLVVCAGLGFLVSVVMKKTKAQNAAPAAS